MNQIPRKQLQKVKTKTRKQVKKAHERQTNNPTRSKERQNNKKLGCCVKYSLKPQFSDANLKAYNHRLS